MTAKEQEKLFARMMRKCGDHKEYASGYVHGVFDESTGRPAPNPIIRQRAKGGDRPTDDPYAFAYMLGFIDAYGEDAFERPWGTGYSWYRPHLRYMWWL